MLWRNLLVSPSETWLTGMIWQLLACALYRWEIFMFSCWISAFLLLTSYFLKMCNTSFKQLTCRNGEGTMEGQVVLKSPGFLLHSCVMSYPNVTFWRLKVLFWNSLWLFGSWRWNHQVGAVSSRCGTLPSHRAHCGVYVIHLEFFILLLWCQWFLRGW